MGTNLVIGLRVDVDTYRGTRRGVPNLCALLARWGAAATFFFSVGPDNMGRHLIRLARPQFLLKMFRTKAARLYGWDTLLRGTFGPGPAIGARLAPCIRLAAGAGHEIGLHAWDHHAWQTGVERMSSRTLEKDLERGFECLQAIVGSPPVASAAPAWKCDARVLLAKARLPFRYNSDCRGWSLFRPVAGGRVLDQPQVPVTLPTYDEVVGRAGVTPARYNDYLLDRLRPGALNVLTVHAEVEGLTCRALFEDFLRRLTAQGGRCVPLGRLLDELPVAAAAPLRRGEIPGREGWGAWQGGPAGNLSLGDDGV